MKNLKELTEELLKDPRIKEGYDHRTKLIKEEKAKGAIRLKPEDNKSKE